MDIFRTPRQPHPATPAPPIHSGLVCGVSIANMNYEQVQDM